MTKIACGGFYIKYAQKSIKKYISEYAQNNYAASIRTIQFMKLFVEWQRLPMAGWT